MNSKIFFTDLDDTLLNTAKEITPLNRAALEELRRRGHRICISTGRALASAKHLARELELDGDGCYIIAYNGGLLYDCGAGKVIYRVGLKADLVRLAFDEAHAYGIPVQTYAEDDAVLAEADTESLRTYMKIQTLGCHIVDDVTKYMGETTPKVLFVEYGKPDFVQRFRDILAPKLGERADLFLSHNDMLECVPPGVNKGAAVRYLCEHLGIPIENSVAAGDAENDLTMIQAAHVGCAMINGEEPVKAAADYVTANDCDHDGIAEILHRFILDPEEQS